MCIRDRFRTYILGRPLTIVTANKALTFIQKCQLNCSHITRCILAIQEYDFEVVYCKGSENIVADALSQNPHDVLEDNIPEGDEETDIYAIDIQLSKQLSNITMHQLDNNKISNIVNQLNQKEKSKLSNIYQVYNHKLYRKEKGLWKLVVTPEISQELLKEIHEAYGHCGVKRTYCIFKEHFTGDHSYKFTKKLIKTCDTCQKCKDHFKKCVGLTKPILPKEKGSLVSIDYYGPLVSSTSGVKYILVIIDNFTKYVRLYPMKRATTTVTLNKLKEYIREIGKPKEILTDTGSQFTSKTWIKQSGELGIKPKFTAIRNPCTNLAERVNRQLANIFRVMVNGHQTRWAKYLKVVEKCINETNHETIEMTPFQAQWGHKPRRIWEKYVDRELMREEMKECREAIYRKLKKKGERQAKKNNENSNRVKFEVGDLVLIKTNPISDAMNKVTAKLCKLFEGPFIIKSIKGDATYELVDINKPGVIRGIFNTRQLKKYHQRE